MLLHWSGAAAAGDFTRKVRDKVRQRRLGPSPVSRLRRAARLVRPSERSRTGAQAMASREFKLLRAREVSDRGRVRRGTDRLELSRTTRLLCPQSRLRDLGALGGLPMPRYFFNPRREHLLSVMLGEKNTLILWKRWSVPVSPSAHC